jgi:hypothetical protein
MSIKVEREVYLEFKNLVSIVILPTPIIDFIFLVDSIILVIYKVVVDYKSLKRISFPYFHFLVFY